MRDGNFPLPAEMPMRVSRVSNVIFSSNSSLLLSKFISFASSVPLNLFIQLGDVALSAV